MSRHTPRESADGATDEPVEASAQADAGDGDQTSQADSSDSGDSNDDPNREMDLATTGRDSSMAAQDQQGSPEGTAPDEGDAEVHVPDDGDVLWPPKDETTGENPSPEELRDAQALAATGGGGQGVHPALVGEPGYAVNPAFYERPAEADEGPSDDSADDGESKE